MEDFSFLFSTYLTFSAENRDGGKKGIFFFILVFYEFYRISPESHSKLERFVQFPDPENLKKSPNKT